MKKLFSKLHDIWSIQELRERIIITLALLLVFRLGSYIVLPGINPLVDTKFGGEGALGLLDKFLGGAFNRHSIFALGIMPYISASIAMQLAQVLFPYFQKLQRDGESGTKKLTQITRFLTIGITFVQGIAYIQGKVLRAPNVDELILMDNHYFFTILSVIVLTTGTMFCMWLGEKITDKGIGNGISMLIMIGIIAGLPNALVTEVASRSDQLIILVIEFGALFAVVMVTVLLVQAVRQVPVQYAKQVVGNTVTGGKRNWIPLRVNSAGVMPIIFAQALMFLPSLLAQSMGDTPIGEMILQNFSSPDMLGYTLLFAFLIIAFTFVYTAISVNTKDIADDLKRGGGFVPGIKPGTATENYLGDIIDKITLPGAIFLTVIAILPFGIQKFTDIDPNFAQFYGGTSLLILVGVVLDTLQQINAYLLMKKYEGLMKTKRVRRVT